MGYILAFLHVFMGALIMNHSDDNGLVFVSILLQVVIAVPIYKNEMLDKINEKRSRYRGLS